MFLSFFYCFISSLDFLFLQTVADKQTSTMYFYFYQCLLSHNVKENYIITTDKTDIKSLTTQNTDLNSF